MRSMVMLAYIRLLYDVEREARDLKLDGKARLALRLAKSVPILDDIKAYLEKEQRQVLPKSPEAQAISYALSNWTALTRYCEDGDLEIDNNGAERSLRGIAVGRKNWMFFGSDAGGRTAAVLTSLIMTCKRLKIDPFAYLRDPSSTVQNASMFIVNELQRRNKSLALHFASLEIARYSSRIVGGTATPTACSTAPAHPLS
jgi:hypothetical protein